MIKKENQIKSVQKITVIGAIINVFLSVAKILVGYIAHSQALIADGIHSLSDLISDAAVLIGSKYWANEPDEKHPYGHGRVETLVSLGIGIALAFVAIGITREAVLSMNEPHKNPPGWLALVVAVISIVFKEFIYRWTVYIGKKINSRALIANAWHHRTDAFSSIPVAVAVIGMKIYPNFFYLDHIAAILVSVLLLKAAYDIAKPCLAEIMEAQVHENTENEIISIVQKYPQVVEIHKVRVRRVGSAHFIELHMLVDGDMTVNNAHSITEQIEKELFESNKNVTDVNIHIEPN